MQKCLIIARYDENLNWLESFRDFKIIIYNKGKTLNINSENIKVINLKNVGRESHTWIYHIVNNYNNLDDINIFLQGRIDDLECMAFKDPNNYLRFIEKNGFAASRYGVLGPWHWSWNVGIEKDKRYRKQWIKKEISRSKIGFRKFSKSLFPEIPILINTSYGGCFAIKKDLIKNYDLLFYKNLLNKLSVHKNPIEGHYMERLWCYMFIKNKNLLNASFDVIKTKFERLLKRKKNE